ncbi:hypothetical protein MJ588_27060 [Klebsiella pneumoniae]|nr:hypothetical protein MJ588_27060 [Klebsiella pneumoniae]
MSTKAAAHPGGDSGGGTAAYGASTAGCCWNLPAGYSPLTRELLTLCDRSLVVVHPDANSHIRLHQLAPPGQRRCSD